MEHLRQTFGKAEIQDDSIYRQQISILKEEMHKMKHNLQDLKNPDEATMKVSRTVKGIAEFAKMYEKIELNAMDPSKQAKHLTKCLEFVLHQLEVADKNQKEMQENLETVILNLDGLARVFTAKEVTEDTPGRFSPASWKSGKKTPVDGQESGKPDATKQQKQIDQLQKENIRLLARQEKEMEDSKKLRDKIEDLESKNKELTTKLKQVKDETDHLLKRLSEVAGNKMKVGNPNIADLSDPNRPQKLSENFGELYSNEWTDALEYLQKKATQGKSAFSGYHTIHVNNRPLEVHENGSISLLFEALKNCYFISKEYSDQQRIAILNAVTGKTESDVQLTERVGSKTVAANSGHSRSITTSLKLPGQDKDFRNDDTQRLNDAIREFQRNLGSQTIKFMFKKISEKAVSNLREAHTEKYFENAKNPDEDKLRIYVEKCAELCWLMWIQFPPIHLKFEFQGDFDGKFYTPYLTSGNKVLFSVWPAMFLHEDNGPLMRKGVVECARKY